MRGSKQTNYLPRILLAVRWRHLPLDKDQRPALTGGIFFAARSRGRRNLSRAPPERDCPAGPEIHSPVRRPFYGSTRTSQASQ